MKTLTTSELGRSRTWRWALAVLPVLLGACDDTPAALANELGAPSAFSQLETEPWPGSQQVVPGDVPDMLGKNIRGMHYACCFPRRGLWVVRSQPGELLRLTWNGTAWVPDAARGWSTGKTLRYPGGSGNPEVQGVVERATFSWFFVANQDNEQPGRRRNSILGCSPTSLPAEATELICGQEWDITDDLPLMSPDGGVNAVEWIPQYILWFWRVVDESTGAPFPMGGSGVLFVGLDNGYIHGYRLGSSGTFTRVLTIDSGLKNVTALYLSNEDFPLWAVCDNRCAGRSATLRVTDMGGRIAPTNFFERPASLPNNDIEGFAFAREPTSCAALWSDAKARQGTAIWMAC